MVTNEHVCFKIPTWEREKKRRERFVNDPGQFHLCQECLKRLEAYKRDLVCAQKDYLFYSVVFAVSDSVGLSHDTILAVKRYPMMVRARAMVCLVYKEMTGCGTKQLGFLFNKDHATIYAALKKAKNLLLTDPIFAEQYAETIKTLKSSEKVK